MSRISIVIPTLGNIFNLQRLLKSIARQNTDYSQIEILVVVNGIADSRRIVVHESLAGLIPGGLQIHFIEKTGVNYARNHGFNLARSPLIMFLDDDCELPEPDFLQRHIELHQKHPQVFATGGGYLLPQEARPLDELYNWLQMNWYVSGIYSEDNHEWSLFLLGGNFSIKSEMARQADLSFDEKIVYGGSESDFFEKACLKGLAIMPNDVDVVHHTRESLSGLTRKIYRQGQGKARMENRYKTTRQTGGSQSAVRPNAVLCAYFNYVFWTGYYVFNKKYLRIFVHILKDAVSAINVFRYKVLTDVSDQLQNKKEKGDRF